MTVIDKKNIAVVTGGTRGIGAAISKTLHDSGYFVIANYGSNDQNAKDFSDKTGILTVKWNVSEYSECERSLQNIKEKYGSVGILVNNAGIIRDIMLHKMNEEQWGAVLGANLTSCFNMCRAVIEDMREQKFGRIVNISSINGLSGQFGQTNYSASKAGIIGFSKALALESASRGITVNVVAPGYIKTDMTSNLSNEIIDQLISHIPVKKLGLPEDIARAVLFLVSDDNGFITGSTISVNGGQYMH